MTRPLAVALSLLVPPLLAGACTSAKLQLPEALTRGAMHFDLQQLQLIPKSGKPIEQIELGRWSTGDVMRSGEEAFTRAGRSMLRGRVEYTVGRKNEELWKVKCDVSRPVGTGEVPAEAASASVAFCAHTPLREKWPGFELRLSLQALDGDAGLVRVGDDFFTLEPLRATVDGKVVPGPGGWAFREQGSLVAAVQLLPTRAFVVSESVSGRPLDVLAAAALAMVASGEPSIDAVRPWVDPGGSF